MEHKELREMNVIPLVDVMLVLLTIVLTTATFIASGEIAVNLPEAKTRDNISGASLFITIAKDEKIFMDKLEVSPDDLITRLQGLNNEQPVVIRADENVPVKRFVFVIDALKGEGFKRVSMEVQER